jgi:hypothetical protein
LVTVPPFRLCTVAFYFTVAITFVVQIAAVSEKNGTTVISISHLEVDMEVNPLASYRTVSEMFKKQNLSDGLTYQYCKRRTQETVTAKNLVWTAELVRFSPKASGYHRCAAPLKGTVP